MESKIAVAYDQNLSSEEINSLYYKVIILHTFIRW